MRDQRGAPAAGARGAGSDHCRRRRAHAGRVAPQGRIETRLAITSDSAGVAEEGSWTANAALTLKTPTTVDAGDYSSTLTLSLFE
ncbi:hypothetical protein MT356_01530 [Rathayibacter festucae]|uniref:hypothetical protein n=1 Tax=Rathayibacter festucae TaxID=110937 RepID=UPI001FB2D6F6|nr:hypothetical protein [Rathayibacter festucae]MCJ1698383.1 hypothetical protein [Rathayibacter festucae]